mmetsp:Transcript_58877/g.140044  ORF Transcript_58877/g.140044 Transcript_58877/m.140044 type:complete len:221 (-) Transcript_58877:76-738(-)
MRASAADRFSSSPSTTRARWLPSVATPSGTTSYPSPSTQLPSTMNLKECSPTGRFTLVSQRFSPSTGLGAIAEEEASGTESGEPSVRCRSCTTIQSPQLPITATCCWLWRDGNTKRVCTSVSPLSRAWRRSLSCSSCPPRRESSSQWMYASDSTIAFSAEFSPAHGKSKLSPPPRILGSTIDVAGQIWVPCAELHHTSVSAMTKSRAGASPNSGLRCAPS